MTIAECINVWVCAGAGSRCWAGHCWAGRGLASWPAEERLPTVHQPSSAQSPAHTHPRYVSRQPAWAQWPRVSSPLYIVLGLTLAPVLCCDDVMVTGVFIDRAVLLTMSCYHDCHDSDVERAE